MKIALIFWGLTRSLKLTINSIKENIINVLLENNIDYDIYLHTYKMNNIYNNKRAGEINISLKFDEYKLLNPDYFLYDEIDTICNKINFKSYHSKKDPWNSNYQTLNNFILAMYSKYKITKLLEQNMQQDNNTSENIYEEQINILKKKINLIDIEINKLNNIIDNIYIKDNIKVLQNEKEELIKKINDLTDDSNIIQNNYSKKYDYIMFLRPDVKYLNKFDIKWFNIINNDNICIPNFCIFNNFNDRFFLSNITNGLIYGKLFEELLEFSLNNELHSETFHYNKISKKYNLKINLIKFYFNRIRANGKNLSNDFKSRRVNVDIIE